MDEEKTKSKTTKKRMFVKGGAPGPGRGNKKPFKPLDQDEFEGVIAEGLRSKDGKERAVWARVMLSYEKQKGSDDSDSVMEPFVARLLKLLDDIPGSGIDAIDVIQSHMRLCPNSPITTAEFEEIEDDE